MTTYVTKQNLHNSDCISRKSSPKSVELKLILNMTVLDKSSKIIHSHQGNIRGAGLGNNKWGMYNGPRDLLAGHERY